MNETSSDPVSTARDYYNSSDADLFYHTIWGGEDIHIGLYDCDGESISEASRRTVSRMAALLDNLGKGCRVLDIGSGFGGAARRLARVHGCRVTALNLSEVENRRHRELNEAQDLDHLIEVLDGNFEKLPFPDETFDVVWSQDAILHSGNRKQVVNEVVRVLKPGGEFIFTDPMQSDQCPDGVLQPILGRIHLDSLGSPGFYRKTAGKAGLEEVCFEKHTHQLVNHYARVLEETEKREQELAGRVNGEYIEKMKTGLRHWVDGGREGRLVWGIFHFRKSRSSNPAGQK